MVITHCLHGLSAYGCMDGQTDFGGQPQALGRARGFERLTLFWAAQNIPCYVLENIKIRLLKRTCSDRSKRQVRWITPYTAECGWISSLYRHWRLDFPCSMKRKRPFPLGGRGWNLPVWESDGRLGRCSPVHHVWIRLQNYGDFMGCGIRANRHLQPLHRHLQPTGATAIEWWKNQCSFAPTNRVINTLTMRVWEHSENQQTEYAMHRNISVSVFWVIHAIMNALTHEHIDTLRTGLFV